MESLFLEFSRSVKVRTSCSFDEGAAFLDRRTRHFHSTAREFGPVVASAR